MAYLPTACLPASLSTWLLDDPPLPPGTPPQPPTEMDLTGFHLFCTDMEKLDGFNRQRQEGKIMGLLWSPQGVFDAAEEEVLRAAFEDADVDGSNSIDFEELHHVLTQMHELNLSDDQVSLFSLLHKAALSF